MRARLVTVCFVLVSMASVVGIAPAVNAQPEAPHCIDANGFDVNEFYGVSNQIVTSFCPVANAGQQWVTTSRWFVKEEFKWIPEGFVPAGDTPLEDFMAKFLGEKYVIDAGTEFEEIVFLPNDGNIFSGPFGDQKFPIWISPITLGSVHPLSIGVHTVSLYWSFSALHCDGGRSVDLNCLAAGEHLFREVTFEVVEGH
jgi:hypothetical protein